MSANIDKITIDINGTKIDLTVEEVENLYQELCSLLGKYTMPWYPTYPTYPIYPTSTPVITYQY